jgi:hypothetical protein
MGQRETKEGPKTHKRRTKEGPNIENARFWSLYCLFLYSYLYRFIVIGERVNGINDTFEGNVGTMVGSSLKGIPFIKSAYRKRTKK